MLATLFYHCPHATLHIKSAFHYEISTHNLEFYIFTSHFLAPETPMVSVTPLIGDSVVEVQAEWPRLVSCKLFILHPLSSISLASN